MVFLKEYFEKDDLKKISRRQKKHEKYPACEELIKHTSCSRPHSAILNPGVVILIPALSHTFLEIEDEIFSIVHVHEVLVIRLPLSRACAGKSVFRLTDHLKMTIAVDWDEKQQTKQTNTLAKR